jgi:hypothetical protein
MPWLRRSEGEGGGNPTGEDITANNRVNSEPAFTAGVLSELDVKSLLLTDDGGC